MVIFQQHKRWFHSSREKLPLVGMSANWFLVLTVLIWLLGSMWFCQTTNQEQLCESWTRVSSLHCALLSIVLITASLSSKMYVQLRLTLRKVCVCGHVIHLTDLINLLFFGQFGSWFWNQELPVSWWPECLCWTFLLFQCSTSITFSQRSRANYPSVRSAASKEIIPDSAALCETTMKQQFASCTSNWWRQMLDFR